MRLYSSLGSDWEEPFKQDKNFGFSEIMKKQCNSMGRLEYSPTVPWCQMLAHKCGFLFLPRVLENSVN